jgi:hypothetical protein
MSMSKNNKKFDEFETDIDAFIDSQGEQNTASTKLEKRRRIEELYEENRLRNELKEYDFLE